MISPNIGPLKGGSFGLQRSANWLYGAKMLILLLWLLVVVYRKLWAREIVSIGFQSIEKVFQSRAGGMEYEKVSFSLTCSNSPT